jgi:hypothetical protein
MKDAFDLLKEMVPWASNHPRYTLAVVLIAAVMVLLYRAEGRKVFCRRLFQRLTVQNLDRSRFLYVCKHPDLDFDWRYYTSENTGRGLPGDDIIWTLVRWPSMKPEDSMTIHGAVADPDSFVTSTEKLEARWGIIHDVDNVVGLLPAVGLMSKLRDVAARVLFFLARH